MNRVPPIIMSEFSERHIKFLTDPSTHGTRRGPSTLHEMSTV